MKENKTFSIFNFTFLIILPFLSLSAQAPLTLQDCITLAKTQSVEAQHAKSRYEIATYDYKLYRKSLLPTLTLSGELPAFNRRINKITLPDGRESFVAQFTGNYSAALSINQPVPFTGGQFYISSGLQRLDIYQDSTTTSYLGNLINIGIRQPIIAYNSYKWQRKIAPVAYQKAEKDYLEALENAAVQVIDLFFNLLQTQISLQLNQQNKLNSDTLLSIAQARFALGQVTEDQLLEVEISNLNLTVQIEELIHALQEQQTALADYLGLTNSEINILEIPDLLMISNISQETACQEALANGVLMLAHQERRLQAESELARAKADNGFSIDLYASFGLSKNDPYFKNIYHNPLDQEQITLSFNIPILDWGVARYKRKKAQAALLDENNLIDKEQLDFKRTVNSAVNQYNIQNAQLLLVNKSRELSARRYDMSRERYLSGKSTFLEYSVAQTDKDNAQLQYLQTLQKCWTKYYEIRKLTLFDFKTGKRIEADSFLEL
jgi:outer membrane protein TolC